MENSTAIKSPPLRAATGSSAQAAPMEPDRDAEVRDFGQQPSRLRGLITRTFNSASTWGFVDQGIVSVASFAAIAIVGRVCTPEELGVYGLAVRVFWLVAGIPNALVWMPYTARAPRLSDERRRAFLGSTTVHLVMFACVAALGLVGTSAIPSSVLGGRTWIQPMCWALVPFSAFMLLKEHLRRVLLAHMDTMGMLKIDIPIAVCQLTILGALAWLGQLSAVTALVGMAAGCSVSVLWLAFNRERFRVEGRRVGTHWGYNFQFGKWLLVVSIAWLLGEASYFWMIESFHGLTVLGQFTAASTVVLLFNPILLTVQNLARSIFANELAKGENNKLRRLAITGTLHIAWIFGLLFTILAVFGDSLVHLFFGNKYDGLGWVVASLCLGFYLHVLSFPVDAALSALRGGQAMLVAAVARLVLIVSAGVPLVAIYGSVGVGFALAIGSLGAGMLQWNLFLRRYQHAH